MALQNPSRLSSRLAAGLLAFAASATLVACFGTDGGPKSSSTDTPPVVSVQPRDTAVVAGSSAVFTVVAQNAASYQWIRLPSDTLTGKTLASLTLAAVDSSQDSSFYQCLVRNAKGTVATRAAMLLVSPAPPETTVHPPAPRNCKINPVVFTEYIMDPSLIKVVAQIGSIGGGNTEIIGRSYIFPKDGQTGMRLPLRAPVDMELVGSKHYKPSDAPATGYVPDWSLYFDAGCGVNIELYHIKDVSDTIKSVSDTTVYSSSAWVNVTRKKIPAGTIFGWYIPGLNSVAFDFITKNDSVTNHFANQARYVARGSNILHTVCPYDLFEPAKKSTYYNLLGTVTGTPIAGIGCGTVERDVIGTPAGQWFFDSAFVAGPGVLGKDGDYGDPLPLIVMPDSTLDIGHLGPAGDVRIQRGNPTWKRLQDITTEWCYQLYPTPTTPDGWLWLKMRRADKMDVGFSSTGTCPSNFPASGFKSYYR